MGSFTLSVMDTTNFMAIQLFEKSAKGMKHNLILKEGKVNLQPYSGSTHILFYALHHVFIDTVSTAKVKSKERVKV